MKHPEESMCVAQRFTDAIADLDIAALESILADDATVWHNTDGVEQPREQALAAIAEFMSSVSDCYYAAIHRIPTPTGLVQQHELRVRFGPKMPLLAVPVCLIFEIVDGRVRRIDEYLDPSAFRLPAEPTKALYATQATASGSAPEAVIQQDSGAAR